MNSKLLKITFSILMISFLIGCSKDNNPVQVGSNPVIEKISIRQKWNVQSAAFNKIEVTVQDPQGFANLATVIFSVTLSGSSTPIFQDSLYDDGAYFNQNDGDVLAGDGVFSNKFSADNITPSKTTGDYIFSFTAIDRDRNVSSPKVETVVFGINARPEILKVSAPDTFKSGVSGAVFAVTVSDSDGIDDITDVWFNSSGFGDQIHFFNDGDFANHGDEFAADSIYSVNLDSTFGAAKAGMYNIQYHIKDSFDETNLIIPSSPIYIENKTGKIISLSVPDTMHRPAANFHHRLLTAKVTDPQGLADIDSVYFFSLRPDTVLANKGNPILLVDNGLPFNIFNPAVEVGDQDEGDGIYSFSLIAFDTTKTGTYKFSFYMRDKAGNLTEVKKDSVTIY